MQKRESEFSRSKVNVSVLFVLSYQEFTRRQLNFQLRTPCWEQNILSWGAYFTFAGSFHLSFLIMLVTYYRMWVVMVMWGQEPSASQNLRKLYGSCNVGKKKGGEDVTFEDQLRSISFHQDLCQLYSTLHGLLFQNIYSIPSTRITSRNSF